MIAFVAILVANRDFNLILQQGTMREKYAEWALFAVWLYWCLRKEWRGSRRKWKKSAYTPLITCSHCITATMFAYNLQQVKYTRRYWLWLRGEQGRSSIRGSAVRSPAPSANVDVSLGKTLDRKIAPVAVPRVYEGEWMLITADGQVAL